MIDHSKFNTSRLVDLMLGYTWQHQAEIVPDYMPPNPRDDTRPKCVVKFVDRFLRFSHGPLQGYSWDLYGDDFHSPELALLALSQAPPPPSVSAIPTHGGPCPEWAQYPKPIVGAA